MAHSALLALLGRGGVPVCFLVVAIPISLLLAFLTPPFQTPDEIAHLLRADQITRGVWRGGPVDCAAAPDPVLCRLSDSTAFGGRPDQPTLGGAVDPGLLRLAAIYRAIPFHPDRTATRPMYEAATAVRFSRSTHPAAFTNTTVYPPLLYLPAAAALSVAKATRMRPLEALHLVRAANIVASLGLAALALRLCRRGARSMAVLLALPMSLALAASAAPDGLMLALAAIAAATLSRAMQRPEGLGWRSMGTLAAVLLALGLGRPPYAALGLLVLAAPVATPLGPAGSLRSILLRLGVALPAAIGIFGWIAATAPVMIPVPVLHAGVAPDMAAQLAILRDSPLQFAAILLRTFATDAAALGQQAVGVLGWLDTPLPRMVHWLAAIALVLALAADAGGEDRRPAPGMPALALALLGLAVVVVGLSLALYLSYTPPGYPTVIGLQGRYFLPPLLMAVPFVPRLLVAFPGSGPVAAGAFLIFAIAVAVLAPLTLVWRFAVSA
ncbi:DUF2142 domain-containing protein [Falsiroseomonas sp. E2-1-a20]|uniref:DUF2142 domain-containing protein n=1 Tax=Falsiroseomonas sp. E2-1-a20 TaxID=3239300 RepID=UPI003F3D9106